MRRPVVHRRDPRLEIITEAIERLIPAATPAFLSVTVTETLPGTGEQRNTWTGTPEGLATKVFTALYGRPRGDAPHATRLEAITETLRTPVPDTVPADVLYGCTADFFDLGVDPAAKSAPWAIATEVIARRIHTALYGQPRTGEQSSPLAQAEDAKRARDLVGELGVLMQAGDALESAPWYPTRPGDLVHVHHPAGHSPAFGETYIVGDAGDGLLSMQLLAHTLPDTVEHADGMTGCFTTEAADCPVYDLWFEAGPHVLTIVRDGRPVHAGGAR